MENNLAMWEYWGVIACILLLIAYYLYMCIGTTEEGWIYNIRRFGRWNRTISGSRDLIADECGNLLPATNTMTFFWLWYGFEKIDAYEFHFVEGRDSTKINPVTDKAKILWGATEDDALITFERTVMTTHHKDQHDYRFRINGLETGKDEDAEKEDVDVAENIKVNTLLNSTIVMKNAYKAQYRAGGDADWYNSLYATIEGSLGEIICEKIYAKLGELRGEKLQNVLVENTEPQARDPKTNGDDDKGYVPRFVDKEGNRLEKITFLQRINYEMMVVKDLGVELKNLTMMDFEPDAAYQKFVDAMQEQAISDVKVITAQNEAIALNKTFDVKKAFIKDILAAKKDAEIAIKKQVDATIKAKFDALQKSKVTVYVDGQSNGPAVNNGLDANKLIENAIGFDMAAKINQEALTGAEDQSPQHQNRKKN